MQFDPQTRANGRTTPARPARASGAGQPQPRTAAAAGAVAERPAPPAGEPAASPSAPLADAPPAMEIELAARVRVIIGRELQGYASDYLGEMKKLSRRQAAIVNVLLGNLMADHVRTQKGRGLHPEGSVVETRPDSVRVLLDRLADDFEAQTGLDLARDFNFQF